MVSCTESNDDLLLCAQALVQAERALTATLSAERSILPTPTSLTQVEEILALARTYSSRTSAPPGWNPTLPVVHFATPNPLPHQLRGGALGAMQLKMARDERRLKKRRKLEKEEEAKRLKSAAEEKIRVKEEMKSKTDVTGEHGMDSNTLNDPKKRELVEHYQLEDENGRRMYSKVASREKDMDQKKQALSLHKIPVASAVATTMNLSDSSSNEEDSDDDDSESE